MWLAFERRLAQSLEVTDNMKVVYVLLEELNTPRLLPYDVRGILAGRLYIKWPSAYNDRCAFFERLTSVVFEKLVKH